MHFQLYGMPRVRPSDPMHMHVLTCIKTQNTYIHNPSCNVNSSSKFSSTMALFATRYCLRSISRCNQHASISSTSTKYGANTNASTGASKLKAKMDMFPIYILVGFTGGAVFLAVRSVSQQLFHHPGVQVNKSNRSMMPEVDTPDVALASGDKFLTRSVLRKVGHIQKRDDTMSMDRAPDATATHRSNESTNLKTVGVDPRANRG